MSEFDQDSPDFSNPVEVSGTDAGPAILTDNQPDFSNSEPVSMAPVKKDISPISKAIQFILNLSPVYQFQNSLYMQEHNLWPDVKPGESMWDYKKRAEAALQPHLDEEAAKGAGHLLEGPMTAAVAVGAVTAPVITAAGVGAFAIKDHFFNARRWLDENRPQTSATVKDIAEIADLAISGALIGGGLKVGKDFVTGRNQSLGIPNNANVAPEVMTKVQESQNLLPEEKLDIQNTLGINAGHIEAAQNANLPLNVTTSQMIDLATKPYWERLRTELIGEGKPSTDLPIFKNTEEALKFGKEQKDNPLVLVQLKNAYEQNLQQISELQRKSEEAMTNKDVKLSDQLDAEGFILAQKNQLYREALEGAGSSKDFALPDYADLAGAIAQKELSQTTMSRLREFMKIDNLKRATPEQIAKVTKMVDELKPGDKFLSEKQVTALNDIIKELQVPEVTPKRVVVEKFGEQEEILSKGMLSKVSPELVPTVDIKQGHPLITKIVNNARDLLDHAEKEISRRNEKLDKMLLAAEKSRSKLLPVSERYSRMIYPRHPEIFQALSGEKVELTREEAGVVAYLKNFFAKAKEDLQLEKYRRNYVTHMEQPLTEKLLTKGFWPTVREALESKKENGIPTELMLELENIIGSEKFFRYALERKGGLVPTTNLRRIVNGYSSLYETKVALDKILPEGQAVVQTLLKGKSAVWLKRFLQNLKGRGMDYTFKNGPMGWLAKVADGIVDAGYLKLLGFNGWSALKNVVAGEANNWIYHDFNSYLVGKQRFIENPKKVFDMSQQFGLLDGTYSDYAQRGIGGLKKLQDLAMVGQRAGEIEVRGSIMASMLTPEEWAAGKISKERVNEMKDVVAMTQGVFSKVDSPLWVQTWYGRMFMQMNRWRITNTMLMRRIIADAAPDIKAGNYNTPEVTRLGKMVVAYGVGMYVSYQLYQAGYKKAGDVAKNMAQTVDGVASLFTNGDLVKMFTDNPTLHLFKEFSNTIQNTANYLHVPGAKHTQEKGIEDTYIAPVDTSEELIRTLQQQ